MATIDERIENKEYNNFPSTKIRLCQIQKPQLVKLKN